MYNVINVTFSVRIDYKIVFTGTLQTCSKHYLLNYKNPLTEIIILSETVSM